MSAAEKQKPDVELDDALAVALPTDRPWVIREVAAYLRKSTSWVYKRTAAGTMPVRRCGAELRFFPEEIIPWAKAGCPTNVIPFRRA